jgi:hypothetical protein
VSDRWHVCPHPECEIRIPPNLFACRVHWYALPPEIRTAIWSKDTKTHRSGLVDGIRFLHEAAA